MTDYYCKNICPSCVYNGTTNCRREIVQKLKNNTKTFICQSYERDENGRKEDTKPIHINSKPIKYNRKNYSEV